MNKTVSVSIPVACGEKWNSFAPTATGGFCGSCQKNVIDFTKATDDEIIMFLSNKPEHACGRFKPSQLKTYNLSEPVSVKPGFTWLKAGAVSLLLLVSKPSNAQLSQSNVPQQTEAVRKPAGQFDSKTDLKTIKGIVRDEDKNPVVGVSVVQKGDINGVLTDEEGRYTITLRPEGAQVLSFHYIGMAPKEISVADTSKESFDVTLQWDILGEFDIVIMGEASDKSVYTQPPTRLKKFWQMLKDIF